MLVVGQSAQLLIGDSELLTGFGAKVEAPGHEHSGQLLDGRTRLFRPLLHLFHKSNSQQESGIKGIDPRRGNDAPIAAPGEKKGQAGEQGTATFHPFETCH
jgi:hypothetical protein